MSFERKEINNVPMERQNHWEEQQQQVLEERCIHGRNLCDCGQCSWSWMGSASHISCDNWWIGSGNEDS